MWLKPRTSDRIAEPLGPAFPEWAMRIDPILRESEQNGIYDAFRCRRAYHSTARWAALKPRASQARIGAGGVAVTLIFCWPVGLVICASLLIAALGRKVRNLSPTDRKPKLPNYVGDLIQPHGVLAEECMDVWQASVSGPEFCIAIYLELRRATAFQARGIQLILAVVLPAAYVTVLAASGRPWDLLSPIFAGYLALTFWTVRQIGPYSVLSGMLVAARELNNRRVQLIRSASTKHFWQLDADHWVQLGQMGMLAGGLVVAMVCLWLTAAVFGGFYDWKIQSTNRVIHHIAAHAAALAAIFWMVIANLVMRHRLRNPEPLVAKARDMLRRAGWAFEVALVAYAGSGDAEIANWMAARNRAGEAIQLEEVR